MAACTGLTASWCPIHGDCTCPRDEHHGEFVDGMDDWSCPLHSPESPHPISVPGLSASSMAAELRRRGYTVIPPATGVGPTPLPSPPPELIRGESSGG